jgi:CubicO group peptidase (beta-lactamase class C family)
MTYEELLRTRVTEVLDLKDTRITCTPGMERRMAQGYDLGFDVEDSDMSALAGAAALRSTAQDMLQFLAANLGLVNTPLHPALQATHEPRVFEGVGGMQVALGWHIRLHGDRAIIWHDGATGGFRSFAGFDPKKQIGAVALTNSTRSVGDLGFHLLDPSYPLTELKPSIAAKLQEKIAEEDLETAVRLYYHLNESASEKYDFRQSELNALGHRYLRRGENQTAVSVFRLNVEAFPDAATVYASLGEGYLALGDTTLAVVNYMKSLDLTPHNRNAVKMLGRLGIDLAGRPEGFSD